MAATDDNLKSQFQLLQEQQQKKLMRRKQRKEEQERAKTVSVISAPTNNAFGVSDELDLKLAEPAKPGAYLSEELVEHLNEQIRELKDENGRVYKLLSERDFELRNLKKKREEEKAAMAATGGPVTNETAGTKIVELSKKVREMTAELESEKNKARQLSKKCHDLQQQVSSVSSDNKSVKASTISLRSSIDEKVEDPNEIKVLQDKLRQMESKMIDYRNSNSSLKQELRIAHKALSQEVGDNVNVQTCLNDTTSWRGRAQTILQLQQKNEELKQEVQKLQGLGNGGIEVEMLGTHRKKTAVERHKEQLKKIEKEKKDAQEKMASEKEALEEDNFALKHKLDVVKTRNHVLSTEIKNLKKQVPQLLQKNEHDNELIEALMKEQNRLKAQLDLEQRKQHNSKLEQQNKLNEISARQQHEGNIVEQLKVIVSDKEKKVQVLENEIQQLKLAHLQRHQASKLFNTGVDASQLEGVTPVPPHMQPGQQMANIDSRPSTGFETVDLHFQINPDTPPESRQSEAVPEPTINGYVKSSRASSADTVRAQSRSQSRSHSKHNRPPSGNRPTSVCKPADQQLMAELQYQCQESRTVAQVAEVERDKLMELTKLLQNRLDECNTQLQYLQKELVDQRRKNVLLEKHIGKTGLTSTRSAGNQSARKKSNMSASVISLPTMPEEQEELTNMSTEELIVNLEIQKDEIEALKTALQTTLKAKEEDLTMYSDTIEETKKVFLQALRQYKQTVHGT